MKRKFNEKWKISDVLFAVPVVVVVVIASPVILSSMAIMKGLEMMGVNTTSHEKFDPITGDWIF